MKKQINMKNKEEIKKKLEKKPVKVSVVMSDRKDFIANKDYLCKIGADFKYESSGSVDKIIYGNREFTYLDMKSSGGRGHHLSKMFKADIDAWLLKNKDKMERWDNNYREQMFNLDAIEKNKGKLLVMIDINDCYWRTAYKLGYITEQTYIKGKLKKAWKIGRNACIGSLCKVKTITSFDKGKANRNSRLVVRTPLEHQLIRNHIIGHVYKMFNQLFEQMGDNFFMFLTDCLVTSYDKLKEVEDFLNGCGYRVKHKPIEFTGLDRNEKKVSWFDFEAKKKNDAGKVIKDDGVTRYYLYSNAQVIHSDLVSTTDCFNK